MSISNDWDNNERENDDILRNRVIWDSFIQGAREQLGKNSKDYHHNKKQIVLKLVDDLEDCGMPPEMICSEVCEKLDGYDITKQYIRKILPKKYKAFYKEFEETEEKTEESDPKETSFLIDNKNVIEVSTDGTASIQVQEEQEDPYKKIARLEAELTNIKLTMEAMDQNNKKLQVAKTPKIDDVKNSDEYLELLDRFTLLQEAFTKHIQENPKQTFTPAGEMKPIETLAIANTEFEIELEWEVARRIFQVTAGSGAKKVFLKIKDQKMVGWETDKMRAQRELEERGLPTTTTK